MREVTEPRSPPLSARIGLFGLWALCLLVVTCTAGARVESPASARTAPVPSSAPSSSAPPRALSGEVANGAMEETERAQAGPLDAFFSGLAGLSARSRKDSVRVLWLGDSHTAADFWSHEVRGRLSADYGDGGPGMVHAGLKIYRHGAAEILREGEWRTRPKQPAYFEPQDDGVFGIGGMRTVPKDAKSLLGIGLGPARIPCEPPSPGCWRNAHTKPTGVYRWELVYRLPQEHSAFTASIGNQTLRVDAKLASSEAHAAAGLRSVRFVAPGTQELRLVGAVGEPELFGVNVDTEAPGVTVDTLGINGARIKTAASWNRAQWVEEVKRRNPLLLVLAYGTNEVGDSHRVESYEADYLEVVGRFREAAPGASCLLLGPTERALPDWTTHPRVVQVDDMQRAVATRLGCAFFSVFEAMGGEGSLKDWAYSQPPLAGKDRVHLTPAGYRRLGRLVVDYLYAEMKHAAP